MFKILHLFAFIFFSFNNVMSDTYSIRGYTKNKVTNEPISNVNVYFKEFRLGTTTNENGYFHFTLTKNFTSAHLTFSHIAYETVRWQGDIEGLVTIKMRETLLKLDEVVITGTKSEFQSEDVPVFTEIINNKEIRASSAMTVGELMEERAGVSRVYNFDGSFNYNLIGLDSKYLLILKDGQLITGKFNDKVDLDQIAISNVEKIEILKGPSSALYGTEAMGGVINIITKEPDTLINSVLKVRGTFFDGNFLNIKSDPLGGDISYDFSFPLNSFKMYSTLVLQKLINGKNLYSLGKDKIDKFNFDGGISWRSNNEKHNIKLGFNYFERVDSSKEKTSTGLLVKSNATNIIRNNIIFNYKLFPNDKYNFSQSININNYTRYYDQIGIEESYFKDDQTNESLIDYDAKFSFSDNKLNLIGGFEFSRPTYNSNRVYGGSHYRPTYGQFFQLGYKISELSSFIGGLRFDSYESTIIASPRIAFLIKPNSDSKLRFSYGEGFRIPSFLELYIDFDNVENGYTVMGNDNLNPEKSKGVIINYEYTNNHSVRVDMLTYLNHFSNKIETIYQEIENSNEPIIYRYENIAEANYKGAEFSISFLKSSRTSIKMNFNARDARDKKGKELPNSIPYSLGSQLDYSLLKYSTRIIINSSFNYRRELQLYHLLNIRLNYNLNRHLSTNIGIKNFMDYKNNRYGPYIGRNIYIEIIKQ